MHMQKTASILLATVLIFSGCAFTAAHADNPAAAIPHNHTQQVRTVAFGADSNTLVSGGDDSDVRIWDLEAGEVTAMLVGHKILVSQLAAFEGGQQFVSAAWDGTAGIWDISNRRLIRTLSAVDAAHDSLYAVAVSSDGTLAAAGGNNRTVTLWETESGKALRRWVLLTDKDEEEVSFGRSLDSNAITVRETAVDDQTRKWKFRDPVISALAFSPDALTLAIGTGRGNVLIQNLKTEEPPIPITADGSLRVHFLAFSADGSTLFTAGGALQAYNAADGTLIREFEAAGRPGAAAISSDGSTLAAATGRAILLLDASTGEEKGRIERVQNVQTLAFSPDGSRIAAATGAAITVYDVNEGNAIVSLPPADGADLRTPHRASAPLRDDAFLADAFAPSERRHWTLELETDALRWADEPDSGVYFNACGLVKFMAAQDVFHRPWNPGTRSFDIVWRVRMDAGRPGNRFIQEGVCVGISSAPPLQMNEDDLAFFIAIHFNGISADVTRGEPYVSRPGYGITNMRRLTDLMPPIQRGEMPVITWSHEALAALGTGDELHIGMRRGADDMLTFSIWCPDSGQNQSNPWWTGNWQLPEELAGIELNTLFIKRLPPASNHMGQQGSGRDDMEMYGTITGLQAALNPHSVSGIEWDAPVLGAGATLTVRGNGFQRGMKADINGASSPAVNFVSPNELQVRLPEIQQSGYYTLTVSDRNGVASSIQIPYGRILDSVSPMESPAGGGAIATLKGAGFDGDLQVFFGDAPAEIVEIVDRNTARVLVPAGEAGRTTVSARAAGATFTGTLSFGYVERPVLFTGEMALGILRAKLANPAFDIYRNALSAPFESSLRDPATLAWACVYEGNDAQVQALAHWFASLDHPPQPDRYDNRLERSGLLAIAFDAVSDKLEPALRGQMLEHLYRSLDTYLAYARNRVWNLRNVSSTNPSSNLAGVLLALVLKDIHPEAAEAIEHAFFELEYYITAAWTEHGDCIDGADFGLQGLSDYILAANMLANVTGERRLLEQQPFQNVHRLYETLAASPRGFMRFRTMSTTRLRGVSVCAYIGTRFNNPLMLWLADHLAVNGADGAAGVAQALVFRGNQAAPAECPPLPRLSVLPKVGWASMRSSSSLQPELIVGVKGFDGPLNHWRHNSVGSFLLHAHGEELLLHPARFMWWGQATEAGNHNLPLIDGSGPDYSGGFITDSFDAENIQAVVIDATPAYKPFANAQRVRRHFVMLGNDTLIVLDDIVPAAGSAGRVRCQFQAIKAVLNPEGNEILVTGEKARLSIRMFGPDATLGSSSRRVEHHQNVWTTAWAEYHASAANPLVFVINAAEAEAPAIPQPSVRRERDVITVTAGERQVKFRNSTNGWALERPDGELLITVREEEPTRVARAVRADAPPVIDGNLDDALWQKTPPASGFRQPNTWYLPVVHDTEMRFAYDDENLYVAIRCFANNLDTLRTDVVYPLEVFETDDHVRMFIDVGNWRSHPRFFDRTITASGLVSQRRFGDMGYGEVHTAVGREGNAWTIEMAIPWSTLTESIWTHVQMPEPKPGTRMGLHLLRVNSDREYSEWIYRSPWTHGATRHWGELIFE